MKKLTFLASLLLAAVTLNGCSQDSESDAAQETASTTGALTPEQKAQIMELAAYYDVDIMSEDNTYKVRRIASAFNMDSVEMYFRFIASMKGSYTFTSDSVNLRLPHLKTVGIRRMLSSMVEENKSPTEIEASISADGGRWVDLVISNTGHGVSIVATYDGRELGVDEEFATLFPNGDFDGSYSFVIPAERYFPAVKVRLSVTVHNGIMCVMSY